MSLDVIFFIVRTWLPMATIS